ncbi:MAG: protein translocase subunit SecD [Kiloniellales bacterium]
MVNIPRWQLVLVAVVLLLGFAFAAPNLLTREQAEALPDWVPSQQISLGLDLRGGSYLLIEVDLEAAARENLENLVDEVRSGLREARIAYTGLGIRGSQVVFQLRDSAQREEAQRIVREIGVDLEVTSADDGTIRVGYSDFAAQQRQRHITEQSLEIVRRRIDATGTREASIQRQGDDRILVQLPGVDNPERIKEIIGQTAKMTFHLVDETADPSAGQAPPGVEFLPMDDRSAGGGPSRIAVQRRVMVSGENLVDAQPSFQNGQPVVSFTFDSVGAKRFADTTRNNVGKLFAIVLDDRVISAPVIREPILGGSGVISGSFTVEQANDLALLLRAGALPAPLTYLEERSIGPGLGADSIRAGEFASVLGLILIVAFVAAVYGLFGLFANVALLLNLVLLMAALSALQATLTLPGIAGIALTLGMAVDANVLIFERIREEAGAGRGVVSAIDAGYTRALTTIVDSNLTTLIAAILLFQFGTGPVKGFAITLSIGLLTSMFTAIMVTRVLTIGWLRGRRPRALSI